MSAQIHRTQKEFFPLLFTIKRAVDKSTAFLIRERRGCLGLLAVHNFYTPLLFFLRKTALRQVVHRDVTRPHFVRSSHLPKSAELAKAILTTINSAIKKSHTRWLLLMAGTTRLELATSCVTGMRSNQLSYAPMSYCHLFNIIR